jgi:tetratricopeptide (TPR) repeat protein
MRRAIQRRLRRLGRSAPAAWLARQCARLTPRSALLHRVLLRHYAAHGPSEQVVVHARALLACDPGDAQVALALGRALQRLRRHAQAAELLEALVRQRPDLVEASARLGRSLVALERYADALPHLERALPRARDPQRVRLDLAAAALGSGDPASHMRWCRELRELLAGRCRTPGDWARWVLVEFELGAEGRPAEAILAALRALPRDPARDAQLLRQLAGVGALPAELLPLADALAAAGEPALAWIASASRLLHAGRGPEAAAALLSLAPGQREHRAWSGLMRAADPAHFDPHAPPRARPARPDGDLAAVISFFDTGASEARLRHFEVVRRRLAAAGVPLLVVELAFGRRPFRIGGTPHVLQVRGGDLMFQRERLFNLGIARLLDQGWKKIAWIDADLVFEDDDWAVRLSRRLDDVPLCQAFGHAHVRMLGDDAGRYVPGAVARALRERPEAGDFWLGLSGLAWAGRADLLSALPLYDAEITGTSDLLLLIASWPEPRPPHVQSIHDLATHRMPPGLRAHYERWARAWSAQVAGRVGFAEGFAQTLYHGPLRARRYAARAQVLLAHDFSPEADLALAPGGAWRWASDKPGLHREVAGFFPGFASGTPAEIAAGR